ncbi:hypothetical protein [Alcaligenes sp. WGS1538]|uniref:hypothetical protein n=1 Tax=Alcaligenes sp. WGS1538 TaxID=3366811 RepID=UPI00372D4255
MTINDFLRTRYVPFGRAAPELDCWGLVRLARVSLFGRPLLPSHADIDPADKTGLTAAAQAVQAQGGFQEVPPRPGAIAAAWRARLCVHVGIVVEADGRLWVLETDSGTGPTLTRINVFETRYTRVIFYDDQNLP